MRPSCHYIRVVTGVKIRLSVSANRALRFACSLEVLWKNNPCLSSVRHSWTVCPGNRLVPSETVRICLSLASALTALSDRTIRPVDKVEDGLEQNHLEKVSVTICFLSPERSSEFLLCPRGTNDGPASVIPVEDEDPVVRGCVDRVEREFSGTELHYGRFL